MSLTVVRHSVVRPLVLRAGAANLARKLVPEFTPRLDLEVKRGTLRLALVERAL